MVSSKNLLFITTIALIVLTINFIHADPVHLKTANGIKHDIKAKQLKVKTLKQQDSLKDKSSVDRGHISRRDFPTEGILMGKRTFPTEGILMGKRQRLSAEGLLLGKRQYPTEGILLGKRNFRISHPKSSGMKDDHFND